jgi:hypothetical protein
VALRCPVSALPRPALLRESFPRHAGSVSPALGIAKGGSSEFSCLLGRCAPSSGKKIPAVPPRRAALLRFPASAGRFLLLHVAIKRLKQGRKNTMKNATPDLIFALEALLEYAADVHSEDLGLEVYEQARAALRKARGNQTDKLFPLGQIVSTPGALEALKQEGSTGLEFLNRHVTGDWGDLCDDDKRENELSVKEGFRILSAYKLPQTGAKLWIITEADRSVTTFLLPDEY